MRHSESNLTDSLRLLAPELLAYFQRRVSPDDAPDLLSDAMIVAWRRARDMPSDPEQARMWLFGIARGTLPNHLRGERRRRALAQRMLATFEHSLDPAPDDGQEVRDAIARLAPDQAELIRLLHWDGFTVVEAAAVLGIPASTARSRYARAKQDLRVLLEIPATLSTSGSTPARTIELVPRPTGHVTPSEV